MSGTKGVAEWEALSAEAECQGVPGGLAPTVRTCSVATAMHLTWYGLGSEMPAGYVTSEALRGQHGCPIDMLGCWAHIGCMQFHSADDTHLSPLSLPVALVCLTLRCAGQALAHRLFGLPLFG